MTDKEFDQYFKALTDTEILRKLEQILHRVELRSGHSYLLKYTYDLRDMVEQELYEELTGRE